ncbi:hypothetical protein [Enterocloster lavalensis]|uniref:hypothetical protein n=1 Tax=Enterocloster lavalensis TaxID=460384 RepID=UPI000B82BDE4|nr:hypothetical protein [Enterocloster lavalensis]
MKLTLSSLPHTWILDLDGTIVEHNGYKLYGDDRLLPGVMDFIGQIPREDYILIVTARKEAYKVPTEAFLKRNGVRFNQILYGMPVGERILINDRKKSGLKMGVLINKKRDAPLNINVQIQDDL